MHPGGRSCATPACGRTRGARRQRAGIKNNCRAPQNFSSFRMQFPAALDLVVKALEQLRENPGPPPRASRTAIAQLSQTIPAEHHETVVAREELDTGKAERLNAINARVAACLKCPHLASSRTQTVFGVGNPNAELMFVGEAPGADEDAQGEPFVGRAGQLLTRI